MNTAGPQLPSHVITKIEHVKTRLEHFSGALAAYLTGSHAYGEASNVSDIDIVVVVAGQADKEIVKGALTEGRARPANGWLDVFCLTPAELQAPSPFSDPDVIARYRESALPIAYYANHFWGTDFKRQMVKPSIEEFVAMTGEVAWRSVRRVRQWSDRNISATLDYPNPDDEFYGYVGPNSPYEPTFAKPLLSLFTWTSNFALAGTTGEIHWNKRQAQRSYSNHELWLADDLRVAMQRILFEWNYKIPTDAQGRRELRELCRAALPWEQEVQAALKTRDFKSWGRLDGRSTSFTSASLPIGPDSSVALPELQWGSL